MHVPGEENEPKLMLVGNSDLSGDVRILWVEGDTDRHEVYKEVEIPSELLIRIAKFLNKRDLEERLIKFLEEV
jgi:hypothetical protein